MHSGCAENPLWLFESFERQGYKMVQSCLATIFLGKLLGYQLRCWPLTRLVMTGQFFKKHLGWAQMRKGLGSNIEATEWTSVTSLCSSSACVNLDRFDCLPFETSRYTMFLLSTNGALRCFESLVLTGSRKIKLNDVLVDWSKQDRCWCQICLIIEMVEVGSPSHHLLLVEQSVLGQTS